MKPSLIQINGYNPILKMISSASMESSLLHVETLQNVVFQINILVSTTLCSKKRSLEQHRFRMLQHHEGRN
ncbi:hypothetical protein F2Q68_00026978 [Brassica cretica]|uniref:Uncharacterized protein n=1 Tax=Brassica cretica TaxID=69181 RepID=A0A8S9IFM3_BRACR|nr:hypothetical protein F2Q68_00026978 [Brassica cretica]